MDTIYGDTIYTAAINDSQEVLLRKIFGDWLVVEGLQKNRSIKDEKSLFGLS